MSLSKSSSMSTRKGIDTLTHETKERMVVIHKMCCYGTVKKWARQPCIVAAEIQTLQLIYQILYKCFYFNTCDCRNYVHSVCMDEYLQHASLPFFKALSHRFLCKECLDSDLLNLCEYFSNIYNKKDQKGPVCDFGVNSLYCCMEKKMKTIQYSGFISVNAREGGIRCTTMLYYNCYIGFLSLLNHQCRSYFS